MTRYMTRVELHGAAAKDYDALHVAMEAKGFARTIKSSDGISYKLPTAEYYAESTLTTTEVMNHAVAAANSVWANHSVITSEAPNSAWQGLPVA